MICFRKTKTALYYTIVCCIGLCVACQKDDPVELMNCPPPADAFVLSTCLLEVPNLLRPENDPAVTFEVQLFSNTGDYYYAFISSSISAPIEVYDACCNNVCRIGFPQTETCDWRDSAEDLGIIWQE